MAGKKKSTTKVDTAAEPEVEETQVEEVEETQAEELEEVGAVETPASALPAPDPAIAPLVPNARFTF